MALKPSIVSSMWLKNLINSVLEPVIHQVVWDSRDAKGQQVSSDVYLYTLKGGLNTYTRKMVVITDAIRSSGKVY